MYNDKIYFDNAIKILMKTRYVPITFLISFKIDIV